MGLFGKKAAAPQIQSAFAKHESKMILFAGSEHGIIPYHVAMQLMMSNPALDILIIDNSCSQDLFEPSLKEGDVGNVDGVSVLSARLITPEVFEKFDYIIAYLGLNYDEEYYNAADYVVLMNNYELSARRFFENFSIKETPVRMLFYNKINPRVTEKYMIDQMINYQIPEDLEVIALEFTEDDASGYIGFLYDGRRPLNKMSKDYREAIMTLAKDITKGYDAGVIEESEDDQ